MCKVSIIVPVYNQAPYLRECLDSLVGQTLKSIEVICIDDGSTDESADILGEYAAKDSRIRIITHETNRGVSTARNEGIRSARGEFIGFADADDLVDSEFFEKLYAASAGYDCVKGEVWNYDTSVNICALNDFFDLNDKMTATGNPSYLFYGFPSAIYRRSFVERYGFCFPEDISYFEDPYFTITLATKLSAIKIVNDARYYYRNVESGVSRIITPEKADQFLRSVEKIFSYLRQCDLPRKNRFIIAGHIIYMAASFAMEDLISANTLHHLREECRLLFGAQKSDGRVKVSVIVPVYNGERYLRRTLCYLILQSLYDIEIICVNDCSTDDSLDILREYQREDERIKIIDCPENGGESVARNIGIRAASGEYLAFMDQDDIIDTLFYENLYAKAEETHADIIKGDSREIMYNGHVFLDRTSPIEKHPLYFSGEWWTALYRREFIRDHHIELPEGIPLGGDLKFLFDACSVCEKLSVVRGVSYYHLVHPDSGDSEETPPHKIRSVMTIFTSILNKIEEIDLLSRDRECYCFYYSSYIYHTRERIKRCTDMDSKMMCIDHIFRFFDACRCKEEVLGRVEIMAPILADILRCQKRDFFIRLTKDVVLSPLYYEINRDKKVTPCVPCEIVVPYIDSAIVEDYIVSNPFLEEEDDINYHLVDNRPQNRPISVVYNEFLDNYDYSRDAWLILMHSDFEFLTYPSAVLKDLDPSKIYGPIGSKAFTHKGKVTVIQKGNVFEKTSDNTLYINYPYKYQDPGVDTLDCMCLIVHSSLVEKYRLRFDENETFDLYVEDFCISAKKEHGIPTEALDFDCVHHSSVAKEKFISKRYIKQLEYINRKYPKDVFGGTVTSIGGKVLPFMSEKDFRIYKLRQEILTGKKL